MHSQSYSISTASAERADKDDECTSEAYRATYISANRRFINSSSKNGSQLNRGAPKISLNAPPGCDARPCLYPCPPPRPFPCPYLDNLSASLLLDLRSMALAALVVFNLCYLSLIFACFPSCHHLLTACSVIAMAICRVRFLIWSSIMLCVSYCTWHVCVSLSKTKGFGVLSPVVCIYPGSKVRGRVFGCLWDLSIWRWSCAWVVVGLPGRSFPSPADPVLDPFEDHVPQPLSFI